MLSLKVDKNIILDLEKSILDPWSIHFTSGFFSFHGATRQVSESVIRVNPGEYIEHEIYDIFYNSFYDIYSVYIKGEHTCLKGHENLVGSFMTSDCQLRFFINPEECHKYMKAFGSGFGDSFNKIAEFVDTCEDTCTVFNFSYNDEYNKDTDCVIPQTECDISIGTETAEEYIINNDLIFNCHIAKDSDGIWDSQCVNTLGGAFATDYLNNNLLETCNVAKALPTNK